MLNADEAAGAVVSLCKQVAVHLVDDVADCLFSYLQVRRLGADVGGVHQRAEVYARTTVEEAPQLARHERQDALEDEDERDPLVVADTLLFWRRLLGDHLRRAVNNG